MLILLATYQGRRFVDQQIASILWQVGVDVHILVRDDGSSDATIEACRAWEQQHPGAVSIVSEAERTGSAPANFFRLLASTVLDRYDYVALADQDDVWFPDKLVRAVVAMRSGGADGYSSDLLAWDEAGRAAWLVEKDGRSVELDYLFQGASAGCTYVLSASAARVVQSTMARIDPSRPRRFSHDWTIYAICRSHGFGWVRDANPGILYRQHGGNDYGARRGWREALRRFSAVRDRWYREHVSWLRRVVTMTGAEREVFDAIDRNDRRWLARNARRFRRNERDARLLAASFLSGLF